MLRFIFKEQDHKEFRRYWDSYVENTQASPRYTTSALENFLEMSQSYGYRVLDESFVLLRNGQPVGLAFLPLEYGPKEAHPTLTFGGRYLIAPLFTDESIAKVIFQKIDEIAIANQVSKIMFAGDALETVEFPYNFLLRFGYLNSSLLNYLIDLGLPGDLLSHCRKGHKSDIKKIRSLPDFSIEIFDQQHLDYQAHEAYREIHRLAAGRVTRSKASFDSQFAKLKNDLAALVAIKFGGKIIAASYFEMHGQKVLYGSAAENPEYSQWPLYHSMVFAAMEYFQRRGYRWLEVSQPFNPSSQYDYYPDLKQRNIGKFKRGFGGRWVNEYRGIKYFDQALFAAEAEQFKTKYSSVANDNL